AVQLGLAFAAQLLIGPELLGGETPLLDGHGVFDFLLGGEKLYAADLAQVDGRRRLGDWSVVFLRRLFSLWATPLLGALVGVVRERPLAERGKLVPAQAVFFDRFVARNQHHCSTAHLSWSSARAARHETLLPASQAGP